MKVRIEPLKPSHVEDFLLWGRHQDPLLSMYNFDEDREGLKDWYAWKTSGGNKKYFAILQGGFALGYMGLRKINPLSHSAYLGIIIDANHMDQGIGRQALGWLIDYGFHNLGLKKIKLEVLPWNGRARSLYESLGFEKSGTRLRSLGLESLGLDPDLLGDYRDRLMIVGGYFFVEVDYMIVTRDRWGS